MPSWTGLTDNIQAINGLCSSETGTPFPLLLTMAEKQRKERRKSLKSRTQHMPKSGAEATPWKLLPTFLFQKQLQASFGHLKITHNKEWMEFLDKTRHYSLANLWEHDALFSCWEAQFKVIWGTRKPWKIRPIDVCRKFLCTRISRLPRLPQQ